MKVKKANTGGSGQATPIVIELDGAAPLHKADEVHGKNRNVANKEVTSEVQMAASSLSGVFDDPVVNLPFICPHSSIDANRCFPSIPALKTELKAISDKAYREIVKESDIDWTSTNYRCEECFKEASSEAQSMKDLGEKYDVVIKLIEKDTESSDYEIPMTWVTSLKRGVEALLDRRKVTVDDRVTGDLLCEHNLRDPESRKKIKRVSTATWEEIVKVFPCAIPIRTSSQDCQQCQQNNDALYGRQDKVKEIRSAEMQKSTGLKSLTCNYTSLPRDF